MQFESYSNKESDVEEVKKLEVKISTVNVDCRSFENFKTMVEKTTASRKVDLFLLKEFDFEVDYVFAHIEDFNRLAREKGVDIILAPNNQRLMGPKFTWGEIKRKLNDKKVEYEHLAIPDDHVPESLGLFFGKNGQMYVFPKSNGLPVEQIRPVHKIPNTEIGVTICGEIWSIKPEDLDGISILYNPSAEADSMPSLSQIMLHRAMGSNHSREEWIDILGYRPFIDNDPSEFDLATSLEDLTSKGVRRRNVEEAIKRFLEEASRNSSYVSKIEKILEKRQIPAVRSDVGGGGIMNNLPNAQVKNLQITNQTTSFKLIVTD